MKEFIYATDKPTKTKRAPVIKKLGALKIGMEQTPVNFNGEPVIVESQLPSAEVPYHHIIARNLKTGVKSEPFGKEYYFASAFVEGDTLYAFASSRHDDKALTMYSEDEGAWHDPRGGHEVRMFKTKDLIHWEEKDVISNPQKRFWNTSVCKGDGKYVMAIEVTAEEGFPNPHIAAFTSFFAVSEDLENWEMLPDEYSYTNTRYNACPTIRFCNGYYYMVCLEALPCLRYASYIYRSKDLENWEVGFHNPILMWSDEDRTPHANSNFTEEELELLETGLNINCSDMDFFERDGKTYIYYANGDQMYYSFLCEAVYDGPLNEFLEAFFL